MAWQLTRNLASLRAQVDARWPRRDRTSDGTIGDEAHQREISDHNPDDTAGSSAGWNDHDGRQEVRAWDMDSDLREPGTTAQMIVDHIRNLPGIGAVLRYMIYNRKIYYASNGWKPQAYGGASAHTEHIHFSGQRTQAADSNVTFNFKLDEVGDMPTADEIVDTLLARRLPYPYGSAGDTRTIEDLLRYIPSRDTVAGAVDAKIAPRLAVITTALSALAESAGQPVDLSEQDVTEIVTGLLAGLPADLAQQVARQTLDEAAARLSGEVQEDPAG